MIIKEVYIQNFGKFSEQHFWFEPGVNIIYGENEFGKSTLCAFIRAMLFGLERGRGKAAARDDFSRYEPWDNPNHYAGSMRFTCGGRNFLLERNFDRYRRSAVLICEDDGEELSVEQGDLEILLGEMTPAVFDNTVLIRQMSAKPGQELADSLRNYAANYYETGSGEVDLQGVLKCLKEKQKEAERKVQYISKEEEQKKEKIRQECRYIEQDMEKIRQDFAENQSRYNVQVRIEASLRTRQEQAAKSREEDVPGAEDPKKGQENRTLLAEGAAGILVGLIAVMAGYFLKQQEWFPGSVPLMVLSSVILVIGIILLGVGLVREIYADRSAGRQKMQDIQRQEQAEEEKREAKQELSKAEEEKKKLMWQREKLQSDWKEKEIRLENLREEAMDFSVPEELALSEESVRALKLAEETMLTASKKLRYSIDERMNDKASEILSIVTGGRYKELKITETFDISVWDGKQRIPLYRLSRGTVEQIYFSIRMAASAFLGEEEMPVILDDVFAFYDEKRVKSALKWLRDTKKQAIIFTCQKREQEIFYRHMEGR
ncbi:hypothetical protein DWX08_08235 [Ruminococcus sp. AF18-22]|nr:hypothetical protein DWX08_08235 [Ruminococcus sp. AF18-22]